MSAPIPKIVVITPVKNEEWILERFLSVTSQFADYIIIADQNSTDRSVDICKNYPKVTLIQNQNEQYDEASRQILLIKVARELVPDHKILLALDADEILAANAIHTLGWQAMLKAKPGTVLHFEKPDLYLTPYQCIRYHTTPWMLGYVDDGADLKPKSIHSIRIPTPEYASSLHILNVKILHYGLTRRTGIDSKKRFYCVLENILGSSSMITRKVKYNAQNDNLNLKFLEESPAEWFTGWENLGIDMFTITHHRYYWYDFDVLKNFHKYGVYHFWLDGIWDFDWEACRLYAKTLGIERIPEKKILKPPKIIRLFINL